MGKYRNYKNKNQRVKIKKINIKTKETIEAKKKLNSTYLNIYDIFTFFSSVGILIITTFTSIKSEGMLTFVVLGVMLLVSYCLINRLEKKCKKNFQKQLVIFDILEDFGMKIGYLNPALLAFSVVAGLTEDNVDNYFFIICIGVLITFMIYYSVKHSKNKKENKAVNINVDEIFLAIEKKPTFKVIMFFFCIIIIILLLKICIKFNIINFDIAFISNIPFKQTIHNFFTNDYVVNVICTIVTAIALYIFQIKYSKHKLKKDFRCNEIIQELYYGIESANNINLNSKVLKDSIASIFVNNFKEKERTKSQKYYDFYDKNKNDFHLSHLALTHHNNDILIESIQMVFFLNLNFKLLNIVNNIKNRKPNLVDEYSKIETLYERYNKKKNEEDLLALGYEVERYIIDVIFMGKYCLDLLKYLGYDPVPTKLYTAIFNSLYPTTEEHMRFLKLPIKEQNKISKAISRKARKVYRLYRIKSLFK